MTTSTLRALAERLQAALDRRTVCFQTINASVEELERARKDVDDARAALRSVLAQPAIETGWVIVKTAPANAPEALLYFTCGHGPEIWGGNVDAMRFARKEDAERLITFTWLNGGFPSFGFARVEEHAWG